MNRLVPSIGVVLVLSCLSQWGCQERTGELGSPGSQSEVAPKALALLETQAIHAQEPKTRNIVRENGQASTQRKPVTWAVLIGVEGYTKVRPLKYCVADVELLEEILVDRGGVNRNQHILAMTDEAPEERQPTRDNILREVADFLKQSRAGDTVLVYFSGHGFREPGGSTFLAPIECDPEHLGLTGVPLATLRQYVESSRASVKLLVLDACHAGNTKGQAGLTGEELEADLSQAVGVYTLASCKAREESIYWEEKRQGLFTYWLSRGLEGAADASGDGVILADELYNFVYARVRNTAGHLNHQQTPELLTWGSHGLSGSWGSTAKRRRRVVPGKETARSSNCWHNLLRASVRCREDWAAMVTRSSSALTSKCAGD